MKAIRRVSAAIVKPADGEQSTRTTPRRAVMAWPRETVGCDETAQIDKTVADTLRSALVVAANEIPD